jgi:hypothetical protein
MADNRARASHAILQLALHFHCVADMPPTMNKTKLGNALKTILLLTVLAANAVADDAATKRQLVGRWEYEGRIIVLKSDGTTGDNIRRWDVQDNKLVFTKKSGSIEEATILKLTKTQFKIKDLAHDHDTTIWTRIAD